MTTHVELVFLQFMCRLFIEMKGFIMKRLPDSEFELMLEIWNSDKPVCALDLKDIFADTKGWAITTILTMLGRLESKGFVSKEKKGKTFYFTPIITKEEYAAGYGNFFLQKMFGNSIKNFVACLATSKEVSKKDLDELRQYLDEQK